MYFSFDPMPGRTVHSQLSEQLRLAIATGELRPGHRLPPVRLLAKELLVSPRTVARVYRELAEEGLVEGRQGRGTFVTALARRERQGERVALDRLKEAVALGLSLGVKPKVMRQVFEQSLAGMGRVETWLKVKRRKTRVA